MHHSLRTYYDTAKGEGALSMAASLADATAAVDLSDAVMERLQAMIQQTVDLKVRKQHEIDLDLPWFELQCYMPDRATDAPSG